ncbi:MAG: hypothetical protein KDD23_06215 [Winogradskyella sp.]|uniref:hypothetical protein n=1 Tax=Mariniflexile maritimum TaxID=2682493 RepID=UPI0012F646FA|nr:hypothetical protein [Mariniflexile maritimum]MCB0388285.1 hypothetical protein [Winogradskyella sp.]
MKTISTKRAEKIARNINAMDLYYQYSDDMKVWKFWNKLRGKLFKILGTLENADKEFIKTLCDENRAKYFGLE